MGFPLPTENLRLTRIATEIGESENLDACCTSPNVVAEGLDPTYCWGGSDPQARLLSLQNYKRQSFFKNYNPPTYEVISVEGKDLWFHDSSSTASKIIKNGGKYTSYIGGSMNTNSVYTSAVAGYNKPRQLICMSDEYNSSIDGTGGTSRYYNVLEIIDTSTTTYTIGSRFGSLSTSSVHISCIKSVGDNFIIGTSDGRIYKLPYNASGWSTGMILKGTATEPVYDIIKHGGYYFASTANGIYRMNSSTVENNTNYVSLTWDWMVTTSNAILASDGNFVYYITYNPGTYTITYYWAPNGTGSEISAGNLYESLPYGIAPTGAEFNSSAGVMVSTAASGASPGEEGLYVLDGGTYSNLSAYGNNHRVILRDGRVYYSKYGTPTSIKYRDPYNSVTEVDYGQVVRPYFDIR
jgi:hypothetical protein